MWVWNRVKDFAPSKKLKLLPQIFYRLWKIFLSLLTLGTRVQITVPKWQWLLWPSWQRAASYTRRPRFESSHRQTLFYLTCVYFQLYFHKGKDIGNGPFKYVLICVWKDGKETKRNGPIQNLQNNNCKIRNAVIVMVAFFLIVSSNFNWKLRWDQQRFYLLDFGPSWMQHSCSV